jgi:hypothetical protein
VAAILTRCDSYDGTGDLETPQGWKLTIGRLGMVNEGGLQRRDECMKRNGFRITACDALVCDPVNKMDANGDCPNPGDGQCVAYCEIKGHKYYGPSKKLTTPGGDTFCGISRSILDEALALG